MVDETPRHTLIDERVACALIRDQFPELRSQPIVYLSAEGTDNHIFRIGNDLCARFPKVPWAAHTARREAGVLPHFKNSPIAVPEVYGIGAPAGGYPHDWSILSWLSGIPFDEGRSGDQLSQARQVAGFLKFLRSVPPDQDYKYGVANNGRGAPLGTRTAAFEAALEKLPEFNREWVKHLWSDSVRAQTNTSPVWLHGDIHPGNVLTQGKQISGIIDWGLCGVGDGACDLLSAWAMFDAPAREMLRKSLEVSDAEWVCGAGWALSMSIIYLPYAYEHGLKSDMSEKMIARLMEDFA